MGRVTGKVAIVTGGSAGLGRADAIALHGEGARVLVTDVNEADGSKLADELNGQRPDSAFFMRQDVRDETRWQEVIAAAVERFGGLHVLVNNAGIVRMATPEACTLDDFRFQNAVMNEGVFLGCKYAIPAIKASGGGSIINMSSVASHLGLPGLFRVQRGQGRRARNDQGDRRALPDEQVQHPLQLDPCGRHRHGDGARQHQTAGHGNVCLGAVADGPRQAGGRRQPRACSSRPTSHVSSTAANCWSTTR